VAVGFAGAIAVAGTVSSDQQAKVALSQLTPLQRAVRISWAGAADPAAEHRAAGVLARR